ncbi:MAG: DUF4214 domain-containing protein [Desulfobulbaceae bacterium]|nr:DUF4214 domain-containing protein [Desulfobulbaceae bacterium]
MKNLLPLFCLLCICLFVSSASFVMAQDPTAIVDNAYQDLLGRRADQDGLRFYRSKIIDEGWSEKQIRDAIRQSQEFKQVQADRIVKRAYEDILNRKPDAAGLEFYRNRLLNDNWTEQQLRNALRNSTENNQVQADQIVSRSYEDILNRKPDKAGLEFYRNHIINDTWTEKQVRDSLRQSQEYLNKHK